MTGFPQPSLRHLGRMTDEVGMVEHACLGIPRLDLGYCTDDAGRGLAVASDLGSDPDAYRLAAVSVRFLARAYDGGGQFRLRLGPGCRWTDDPPSDDAAGRALLGLGTAAARAPWPEIRAEALDLFGLAAAFRSGHPRAMGYAMLGAAEVARAHHEHVGARRLIADALDLLSHPAGDPGWPWPEPHLTYANALIPGACLAAASAAGRPDLAGSALSLLDWLVAEETRADRFSFTPVGGRGPGGPKPAFDQQPIEAASMVSACARAFRYTGAAAWAEAASRAASWFLGRNDVGIAMFDPCTGGGFDGLRPDGVNGNQGAESTLAFVAAMTQMHKLGLAPILDGQAACDGGRAVVRASRR